MLNYRLIAETVEGLRLGAACSVSRNNKASEVARAAAASLLRSCSSHVCLDEYGQDQVCFFTSFIGKLADFGDLGYSQVSKLLFFFSNVSLLVLKDLILYLVHFKKFVFVSSLQDYHLDGPG